jgi:hypothetical protein
MGKHISLAGLLGLGLYQITQQDWSGLITTVTTIVGLLGVHQAVTQLTQLTRNNTDQLQNHNQQLKCFAGLKWVSRQELEELKKDA